MIEQRDGYIAFVTSGMGLRRFTKNASYAANKPGVIALMKTATRELGEFDIKVNALCPGFILHKLMAKTSGLSKPEMDSIRSSDFLSDLVLCREGGSPEEFADFIVHLTTMQNISGQIPNTDSKILF